jgi:Ser/Thr protein kinase RdoA (MazF antagonist)
VIQRWRRSVPTEAAVAELVGDRYGIDVRRVVLLRSLANDVYRIDGPARSYALKLYGVGRWTLDEVRWEQQLVGHLHRSGVPVTEVVPLVDDEVTGVLPAPEGERPFALTRWSAGTPPVPPWTDDLYRRFGTATAHLHRAADAFGSDLPRRPARRDEDIGALLIALADRPRLQALVRRAAETAGRRIQQLADRGLRRGIRHGDVSLDNILLTDTAGADSRRIVFHDFDLAAPGWQVEDLVGALSTPHADAFLAGYTAVRALPAVDREALPWLTVLGLIDNLHFHLVTKPALFGTWTIAEGWADRAVEQLTGLGAGLGFGD